MCIYRERHNISNKVIVCIKGPQSLSRYTSYVDRFIFYKIRGLWRFSLDVIYFKESTWPFFQRQCAYYHIHTWHIQIKIAVLALFRWLPDKNSLKVSTTYNISIFMKSNKTITNLRKEKGKKLSYMYILNDSNEKVTNFSYN